TTEFVPVDPAEQALLSLTDQQVEDLARQALIIEDHYGRPMDIEWGLDGADGGLCILQARPETVQSRAGNTVEKYILDSPGEVRAEGRAIGARTGARRGGRAWHAARSARGLGRPAVVGTGNATEVLRDGEEVTVCAAEGDTGFVYEGLLDFTVSTSEVDAMPPLRTKIMMNVGNPEQAFGFARLPHAGVGLARLEFIVNRQIGIHPRALLEPERLDAGTA